MRTGHTLKETHSKIEEVGGPTDCAEKKVRPALTDIAEITAKFQGMRAMDPTEVVAVAVGASSPVLRN